MVGLKLSALGFLVFVVFILQTIAVFTPNWFISQITTSLVVVKTGIVPYYSNNPTWVEVSSILLFASLALTVINVLIFTGTYFVVRHQDYSRQAVILLHAIALFSIVTIIFNGTSIILMATNINKNPLNLSFGYSAWFCVSATVVTALNILVAEYIVNRKGDEGKEEPEVVDRSSETGRPPRILTTSFTNMYQ